MVPLPRFTDIAGIPISHFLSEEKIQKINQRTRQGGGEILALKQHSSAYDSPAAAVAEMVDAISHNRRRILPCVSVLEGEYGQHDIAMGVPSVLDESGLSDIIELELTTDELAEFQASAKMVSADIATLR